MSTWTSGFEPFDRVTIDGDPSLVGRVTSFAFRPARGGSAVHTCEVSYVHAGDSKVAWVEEERLGLVEPRT